MLFGSRANVTINGGHQTLENFKETQAEQQEFCPPSFNVCERGTIPCSGKDASQSGEDRIVYITFTRCLIYDDSFPHHNLPLGPGVKNLFLRSNSASKTAPNHQAA